MCGRVIRTSPVEDLRRLLDLDAVPADLPSRYNLAPRQPIPVVRTAGRLELLRWGLTMRDPHHAGINARVESLSRPFYRDKIRERRCLVVVDGFYEWQRDGKAKQPFLITRGDRAPMVLGGIYDATGGCAILTMPSEGVVAGLHDRMPVMLQPASFTSWLDPACKDVGAILRAAHGDGLVTAPVSRRVNDVRVDEPSLIRAAPDPRTEAPRGKTLPLF
jgi:putative SOS response-associated peptidase YedK